MFKFFKNIGNKKAEATKKEYEAVKKGILEAVSKDAEGNKMFNSEKYNEMCEIKYSNEGEPVDMVVTIKKMVGDEVVCEKLSMRENHNNPKLHELLVESARLGDSDLFSSTNATGASMSGKMVPINKSNKIGYSTGAKLYSEEKSGVVSSRGATRYKN